MFTQEFINEEGNKFILIASHSLELTQSVKFSNEYMLARISYGRSQLPPHFRTCRVIYDISGQSLADVVLAENNRALKQVAIMESKHQ